ncbi:MAG TPA: hypothetical protein VEN81_13220 [Planctomycetota bacterium]|nr:hypothetical protein [Planctomycetota bacterium]
MVDFRALGWGFVNRQAPPARPAPKPVPFLGAYASEAVLEAAKNLEKARAYAQRVHDSYQDLAAVIGEEKAAQAFEDAKRGVDRAQKAYDVTVEITGGSR